MYRKDGIFGRLLDESGGLVAHTLEHAYPDGKGNWLPKVAADIYTCLRHAPNRLPYVTFELQNVPDFQGKPVSGILIHVLNFNHESQGCIGLGESISFIARGEEMLVNSKKAFEKFMALQKDVDSFNLVIVDDLLMRAA
jgi:hypothetical protein